MIKAIITLFFGFAFISCQPTKLGKDNYIKDQKISNSQGVPKDSNTFYFPAFIQQDNDLVKIDIDIFKQNWYSSALYSAKEPILYNFYLGHDIYRFLWLRSFHRPVVISIHKHKDKVWLILKELNKQPEFLDEYTSVKFVAPDNDTTLVENTKDQKFEIVKKADRKAHIILNRTVKLTENEWTEFEMLLSKCSFWDSRPTIEIYGLDGSEWIIEAHLKNNYGVMNRWSPDDNFRKVGEYLIIKSGFKEEIY